jgi:hypothetical protein
MMALSCGSHCSCCVYDTPMQTIATYPEAKSPLYTGKLRAL